MQVKVNWAKFISGCMIVLYQKKGNFQTSRGGGGEMAGKNIFLVWA
jgi:hypothetical protein